MEAESAVKPKNEVVRLLRNDFCRDAQSQPRAFLRVYRREIKSSGEPWSKIVSDWFQQKTINVFLIGPFKFAREWLDVRQ